jgi:Arc/MetJ-type ribon-helix-helix transcriptional regulator
MKKDLNISKIYTFNIPRKDDNMGQKLLLSLPKNDLKKIDALIKSGEYTTKSELIRFAIKQFLYSEERMKTFEEMTKKLQEQTRAKGMTRKDIERDIEWAKEQTRKDMLKLFSSAKGTSKLKRDHMNR